MFRVSMRAWCNMLVLNIQTRLCRTAEEGCGLMGAATGTMRCVLGQAR